jgi:hypothetical protein
MAHAKTVGSSIKKKEEAHEEAKLASDDILMYQNLSLHVIIICLSLPLFIFVSYLLFSIGPALRGAGSKASHT